MNTTGFTNDFLPHLTHSYVEGQLPLHALVDIDLWQHVFPDRSDATREQFHWYQVGLTCNPLKDQSLLLTFTLPEPINPSEARFIAIRLMPQEKTERRAVIYTLRKPKSIFDQWNIHYLPIPNKQDSMEQKFRCKIDGTDSLRNFVLTVQQIPFADTEYDKNWFSRIKDMIGSALSVQKDEADYSPVVSLSPSL